MHSARKDVILPLGTTVKSNNGQSISEILLKKNTDVVVGIAAANRDLEIWGDDADTWKPERWIDRHEPAKERLPGAYSGM
jgi:cytochrome P450